MTRRHQLQLIETTFAKLDHIFRRDRDWETYLAQLLKEEKAP